jgi:hypothetical protein
MNIALGLMGASTFGGVSITLKMALVPLLEPKHQVLKLILTIFTLCVSYHKLGFYIILKLYAIYSRLL